MICERKKQILLLRLELDHLLMEQNSSLLYVTLDTIMAPLVHLRISAASPMTRDDAEKV